MTNFLNSYATDRWIDTCETSREGKPDIIRGEKLPTPPFGIKPMKGMKNVFLSREYADFSVHHDLTQYFRIWLSHTCIPDESYFSSLARIQSYEKIDSYFYNVTLNLAENLPYLEGLCPRFSFWYTSTVSIIKVEKVNKFKFTAQNQK